jgi:hypothetical protein
LEHARGLALRNKLYNELRRIICLMGIAKGSMNFSELTESILVDIQAANETDAA